MKFFFLHLPRKNRKTGEHTMVTVYKRPYNLNEGSEFLDDAIRMTEQPLMYAEAHTAAVYQDALL